MKAWTIRNELLDYEPISNKSIHLDKTYTSVSGDRFKVLTRVQTKGSNNIKKCFLIEFKDGTKLLVSACSVSSRKIRNPNKKYVKGVGFMGQGFNTSQKNKKEYFLWTAMLGRCYDERVHDRQPTYKGCTVDERWHNFQNFCEDIKTLENYTLWLRGAIGSRNPYDLDKDIKVDNNKCYSKNTCMFALHRNNCLKIYNNAGEL